MTHMDKLRPLAVLRTLSALGASSLPASAQLVPVSFAAEALMTTSSGTVRLCGMRLFAVEEGMGLRSVADGSVNIGVSGHGLVKAGLREITISADAKRFSTATASAYEFAWMKTRRRSVAGTGRGRRQDEGRQRRLPDVRCLT